MDWLRPLTYFCGLVWLLGAFEASGGGSNLGPALIDTFGTLTILLLVAQGVIWIRRRPADQIRRTTAVTAEWLRRSAAVPAEWFRRSALMLAVIFGAVLLVWMNAYETLPNGAEHRNRISGFVCNIDASCWFSND
jgi:hypothetical protein